MTTETARPGEDAAEQTIPPGGAIPMHIPVVHIASTAPAPLPPAKSFDEILAELTDPAALERHVRMMAAYDAACAALLTEADVQVEGKRAFKKKSAWRKLAQYFRVSTTMLRNERWWEIDEETGEKHLVVRVVMRGIAPWGQIMEAVGLCSTRESRFYTSGIACPNCTGPMWDNRRPGKSRNGEAFRCKNNDCPGIIMPDEFTEAQLQRRPNTTSRAKADHDCEGTAATRATNRAISDLIAAGEVSAEEIEGGEHHEPVALLDRMAFGKDWQGKTWRQVLEAGEKGESFIDWVIKNAERMSAEDKGELRVALDALVASRRKPAPAPAAAAAPAGTPAQPQRSAVHQQALVFLSTNGGNLPDEVAYAGELVQTDDLKAWIRNAWRALHQANDEAEKTAIEAANGAAAYMRMNRISYQGEPPVQQKAAKPAEPAAGSSAPPANLISKPQMNRLFAIAHKEGGYSDFGIRAMVEAKGYTLGTIPKGTVYDDIVTEAGNPERGEHWNDVGLEAFGDPGDTPNDPEQDDPGPHPMTGGSHGDDY